MCQLLEHKILQKSSFARDSFLKNSDQMITSVMGFGLRRIISDLSKVTVEKTRKLIPSMNTYWYLVKDYADCVVLILHIVSFPNKILEILHTFENHLSVHYKELLSGSSPSGLYDEVRYRFSFAFQSIYKTNTLLEPWITD